MIYRLDLIIQKKNSVSFPSGKGFLKFLLSSSILFGFEKPSESGVFSFFVPENRRFSRQFIITVYVGQLYQKRRRR